MEELDFFEEICLISLYAGRAVKFAAVVDSDGRMVTGKFRKINGFEGPNRMENSFKPTGGGYSFYHNYLIPALNNRATICWLDWSSNKSRFEIVETVEHEQYNNSKMLLAITPLTQRKDKFLCIYLQIPSQTSGQHQQIMSRICDAIH
jgi:hypothetical protein